MNQDQLTIEQFGATVKAKYPAYASYSDAEIGQKMLTKYPQYQSKIIPATQSIGTQEPQKQNNFLTDALKTLLVKPAVRFGQAVAVPISKALGATDEDIAKAAQMPVNVPFAGKNGAITIEPQKAFNEGGGAQLFSDALKSASYLAPYGKIAKVGSSVAGKFVGDGVARIAGGTLAGAAGGYATDISSNVDKQGITGDSFVPGFGTLIGGLTGGALEAGGLKVEQLTRSAKELGKELEEQTFKLTPSQRTKLGSKLDDLTRFSAENIPAGNPGQRFAYADDLGEHFEEQLQKALSTKATGVGFTSDISKATIDKADFIKSLDSIKDDYQYDRDFTAINKQIDGVIETIKKQYPQGAIPIDKLNIFKRSTYQNAYNRAGDKVLDTIEHDIGDRARMAIENAAEKAGITVGDKSIGQFNKEYGNLIQVKKLLKLAQDRPELGFTKRITSRIMGGIIGNAIGGIPGLIGGELLGEPIGNAVAGTAVKTGIAKKLMAVKPTKAGSVIQRLRP